MSTTEPLAANRDLLLTASRLLLDHQPFHSEFQLRWMIVSRNGGTRYGCYKQVLREIEARLLALNECAQAKSMGVNGTVPAIDDCVADINQRRSADLVRELTLLCEIGEKLKRQIGLLDEKRRACLEMELWNYRARRIAALDLLTLGQISRETLEMICALPISQRQELLDAVFEPSNHARLVETYLRESNEFVAGEGDKELVIDPEKRFLQGNFWS